MCTTPLNGRARLTGKNIICIAVVGWDRIWQRQNEVMTRLSSTNNVLVIENLELHVRRAYFAKGRFFRAFTKAFALMKKILRRVRRVDNGIIVFSASFLPFSKSKCLAKLNAQILIRSLNKLIRRLKFYDPIFWIYLPSNLAVKLISNIPHRMVVYDCASNFRANPLSPENLEISEKEIIKRARIVFVDNRSRYREIVKENCAAVFVPNGVNFSFFEKVRKAETEVPPDMSSIPYPIIGYTGTLHYWVDFDLLAYLADSHPDWSIVLIGPVDTLVDTSQLVEKRNVHFLGPKMHSEIPYYAKFFDVSIIPYKIHEFTKYVYPTKLHEYLALGKPVVSTNLVELSAYKNILKIALNPEEFAKHIDDLLENKQKYDKQLNIDIARQNSWDVMIEHMTTKLHECL